MALSQIASRFSFLANCDLFQTKYSGLLVGMGGRRALFSHSVSLRSRVSADSRRIESLVSNASVGGAAEVGTVVIEGPELAPIHVLAGRPLPLGATACDGGVNFAIYSSCATAAVLCLFTISDLKTGVISREEYGIPGPGGDC